ncbi:serine protease [Streptomyces cyaneochromogenes]|uniref:Serine protease n=1 Tax=Streptomyces cyaneochromogenes TaxID=2496836 RepID=A0A3Q9F0B8_9ACTN|nr:trypsin-like peptidase domain-containing protein [Streptomyces cyaneochromogenes]AZQ32073.1 serine protease [Streptomyces cyaneochromogenes]AZQ40150.1 serine protease [Streptomyces cyaneochromogenes]
MTTVRVKPRVAWPRSVVAGEPFLVSVDLALVDTGGEPWPFEDEEIEFTCLLNGGRYFRVEAVHDASVVLHRFGGSYGPAEFVVVTRTTSGRHSLRLTPLTSHGVVMGSVEVPVQVGPATAEAGTRVVKLAPRAWSNAPVPVRRMEAGQVAEIIVLRPGGLPGRRGSGYRVGPVYVLTAAHVVAGPTASVQVCFDAHRPGEWSADAHVVLLSEAADLALLEITAVPPNLPPIVSPRYAAIPEADAILPFSAVGFPQFQLRTDPGSTQIVYRDSCLVRGTISVLSNRREATMELVVAPPSVGVAPERSPWEGMSGAAVWCDGALVGMVSFHHRSDGIGRLAACRVDRWYDLLSPAELELLQHDAGLPPRDELAPADVTSTSNQAVVFADLPADLPLHELADLVDALTALPLLRSPNGMSVLLDSIDPVIPATSPRSANLRIDLFGIVRTCLRYPGTLGQLLEAVRLLEGPSMETERVDHVAGELTRRCGHDTSN